MALLEGLTFVNRRQKAVSVQPSTRETVLNTKVLISKYDKMRVKIDFRLSRF